MNNQLRKCNWSYIQTPKYKFPSQKKKHTMKDISCAGKFTTLFPIWNWLHRNNLNIDRWVQLSYILIYYLFNIYNWSYTNTAPIVELFLSSIVFSIVVLLLVAKTLVDWQLIWVMAQNTDQIDDWMFNFPRLAFHDIDKFDIQVRQTLQWFRSIFWNYDWMDLFGVFGGDG
jgi:hypothetical protein